MMRIPTQNQFKVILVGDSGVGKTCVTTRGAKDLYENQNSTIGFSFQKMQVQVGEKTVSLQVWDTAGQERYKSIIKMYYRGAQAALVVYDITNSESFEGAKNWAIDLKRNENLIDCSFFLVGNKADLSSDRQVPAEEGENYARQMSMVFFEVSAKSGLNITQMFKKVSGQLLVKQEHKDQQDQLSRKTRTTIVIGQSSTYGDRQEESYCCQN